MNHEAHEGINKVDSRLCGNDEFSPAIAAPKQRMEEGNKAKHVLCFAPDFQPLMRKHAAI